MENNFKCVCGKEYFIYKHTTRNSGHFDKFGKELLCECGEKLIPIPKTTTPFLLNIGRFNMLSRDEKSKVLKKRSSDHFKKEILESKNEQLKSK